eukprot:NODE_5243_length_521_cov_160.622881_g3880_i0.p2 GENE.NODE_5243_length_521_cov_160.622881_g3880_i0~~NODE_5243_length_521_cov_160.622881_g3880_i0.p2  ORF type:complete len:79 (-),score=41.55 NODE_5243_length_521_cov_160.622881_g3880_i0:284-496(-)
MGEYFCLEQKRTAALFAAALYAVVVVLYSLFRSDLKRRVIDKQADGLVNVGDLQLVESGSGLIFEASKTP